MQPVEISRTFRKIQENWTDATLEKHVGVFNTSKHYSQATQHINSSLGEKNLIKENSFLDDGTPSITPGTGLYFKSSLHYTAVYKTLCYDHSQEDLKQHSLFRKEIYTCILGHLEIGDNESHVQHTLKVPLGMPYHIAHQFIIYFVHMRRVQGHHQPNCLAFFCLKEMIMFGYFIFLIFFKILVTHIYNLFRLVPTLVNNLLIIKR
ncbi:hypothetical protein ACJX0J_012629 [Zea mays]